MHDAARRAGSGAWAGVLTATRPPKSAAAAKGPDPVYVGAAIEMGYGRALKRARDLWGSGGAYEPVPEARRRLWRAGADISTFLMSDVRSS